MTFASKGKDKIPQTDRHMRVVITDLLIYQIHTVVQQSIRSSDGVAIGFRNLF